MKSRRLGITLSYGYTVLNMLCGVFLSAFLLRMLGDTEYGVYKTVSSFASMLVLFEFGTGTVMTRNLTLCRSRKESQDVIDKNVSTIWTVTNILAVVIVAASIAFFILIGILYNKTMTPEQIQCGRFIFIFIAVHLIVSFYSQTLYGIVMAYEYYSYTSIIKIATILCRAILLICLISQFKHAFIIAVVDTGIIIVTSAITIIFCKMKCDVRFTCRFFDRSIFINSMPLCIAIFLQVIVNQANNNVDNFLIGMMLNPESVAVYSIGLYMYSAFSALSTVPITMYAPQVIGDVSIGLRGERLTKTLIEPCRLVMITGGTVLFGFIVAGRQFVEIVYGAGYERAWVVALLIMIPMMINIVNGVAVNVLDAMNKRMARSEILIATTILNILLTVFWLKHWGIIGAAAATAVSTILGQVIAMNIYYSKVTGLKILYLFNEAFRGILPYQIIGMMCAILVGMKIENVVVSIFACSSTFIIVFGIFFMLFGISKEEKEKAKIVFSRLKKW